MMHLYSVFGMLRCSLSISMSFRSNSEILSLPEREIAMGGKTRQLGLVGLGVVACYPGGGVAGLARCWWVGWYFAASCAVCSSWTDLSYCYF